MDLHIDMQELARALAHSQVSSEGVFGAAQLEPAAAPAPGAGSAEVEPTPAEQRLLRGAYARLLGDWDFPEVLDLLGSSDPYAPRLPGTHLTRPGPGTLPRLPFDGASFDAVLVTLGVGRLGRPLELFREIARVLRSRGLVVVSFAPGQHDAAHTRLWASADDHERLMLAEAFIEFAGAGFSPPTLLTVFEPTTEPTTEGEGGLEWQEGRSPAVAGAPHVHLAFAYRDAVAPAHADRPPFPRPREQPAKTRDDVHFDGEGRPSCPYCGERMGRYAPPVTVFEIDYGVDELYVCFNDRCEYHRRSRRWMRSQGHAGFTYRFMLNPETGATGPLPDSLWGGLKSCRID